MAAPEMPLERLEPWTFDDLLDLPESLWRVEIVDGGVVMTPPPGSLHEVVSYGVRKALSDLMPPGYWPLGPIGIDIHPTYLIPDIVVVRAEDELHDKNRLDPAEVFLVVEVVSTGSVSNDRILKPAKYAAAGIPAYWRVETRPEVSLTAYALADGATVYTETGTWGVSETAYLTKPFEMEVPVAGFRWPRS
ncbi:Uma2 family endonuclease [Phytoactinopolyspora endophytica]|uniref:Uma2 family endonuclease n=1 Tax=Phytoactinopolyspora endophytica TaxID=1642495 RepID=UPI0013ECE2A1|nr:Uma2 family endonuclease [Phytoactinopolyspora endophytica]